VARWLAIFLGLLGTLQPGCHRSAPAPEVELPQTAAVQTVAVAPPASSEEWPAVGADACRSPGADRIVAIGDLHGDLKATKRAFALAGATNEKGAWIGGKLVVVQTGDVLDRGDDESELLAFLEQETALAQKSGGQVIRLNGNHEVMNVQGDYRYVTERGFAAYASEPRTGRPDAAELSQAQRGRAEAFLPGGRQARKLAAFPVVWIVGDSAFAHGGILPAHLRHGLDRMNSEIAAWMRGEAPLPKKLQGDKTPFWIRDYGDPSNEEACAKLSKVLTALKAARLVVGHTPQKSGITFDCDRHLARIDVGLSSYYGSNPTEVLEIAGGTMRVMHDYPKPE
jgi:hypothetical protein